MIKKIINISPPIFPFIHDFCSHSALFFYVHVSYTVLQFNHNRKKPLYNRDLSSEYWEKEHQGPTLRTDPSWKNLARQKYVWQLKELNSHIPSQVWLMIMQSSPLWSGNKYFTRIETSCIYI